MIGDVVVSLLLLSGGLWTLVAAVGVVRMPDVLTRMHPATKAASLGLGCVLVAVAVHFAEVGVAARASLVLLFVFLTAPVAAHRIGRAAYLLGEDLWAGTVRDDLRRRREGTRRSQGTRET